MPFYFTKTVRAGPFNFNFSKGGLGVSVGVKGLRLGTGPRGHYVHASRGGFSYRATIDRPGRSGHSSSPATLKPAPDRSAVTFEGGVHMVEIESGDVLAMRDEAIADLLDDINEKRRQVSMVLVLGLPCVVVGLIAASLLGAIGVIALVAIVAFGWGLGAWLDSYHRTCVLFYELEPEVERGFEEAVRRFDGLAGCSARWHVEAGGAVRDLTTWKRNAGATHIVRKKPTTLEFKLPKGVTCNITPPALHVGRQVIYFLPDVALVEDGGAVGAITYSQLSLTWQDSNFIESGVVPADAEVIRHTWKHPNKSGGPDRRFRDNRQIPVCRYEVMHLRSATGLNELVEFSRTGVAAPFAEALRALPTNSIARGRAAITAE